MQSDMLVNSCENPIVIEIDVKKLNEIKLKHLFSNHKNKGIFFFFIIIVYECSAFSF